MSPVAFDQEDDGPRNFGGAGSSAYSNLTRKLLWANGIAFALSFLLYNYVPSIGKPLWEWLRLDPERWFSGVPAIWQLWTFGFLHDLGDPFHILFNMLALYFFGTMLEAEVGSRRFAWQYFAALAIGAIVHLAFSPLMGYATVVGASGAVFYCVIACAVLRPNAPVLFFFVTLPLKVMALIMVGLNAFILLKPGGDRTAADVHLAGMAFGFFAARRGWIYFDPKAWWSARRVQRVQEVQASDEQRLDQLLERIHRDGIHTLSQRDKDFLARMSKRG